MISYRQHNSHGVHSEKFVLISDVRFENNDNKEFVTNSGLTHFCLGLLFACMLALVSLSIKAQPFSVPLC